LTLLGFLGIVNNNLCWCSILSIIVGVFFLCVLYGLIMTRKKTRIKLEINSNFTVTIEHGDLFEKHGTILIPVNEYFDTIVDDVIIDHKTLHGQFIDKNYGPNVDTLDELIQRGLSSKEDRLVEINDNRQRGKKTKYKLGTCVDIENDGNKYILFAFTHFDKNDHAYIDTSEIPDVIFEILKHINHRENIYLPVFGTGLSRIGRNSQRMLLFILECLDIYQKYVGNINIECYDISKFNLNTVESFFDNNIKN